MPKKFQQVLKIYKKTLSTLYVQLYSSDDSLLKLAIYCNTLHTATSLPPLYLKSWEPQEPCEVGWPFLTRSPDPLFLLCEKMKPSREDSEVPTFSREQDVQLDTNNNS